MEMAHDGRIGSTSYRARIHHPPGLGGILCGSIGLVEPTAVFIPLPLGRATFGPDGFAGT
jgi:hypothetical protein